jgi:hypothetical protein
VVAGESTSRLPSDKEIKAAQRTAIKPVATPSTESARALDRARRQDAAPGATTAPAGVLDSARSAARAWIRYRIDGVTPKGGVLPGELWHSVPPAAPVVRMMGAALTTDLTAFAAHPEGRGWVISVSTRDPRMPVIVVKLIDASDPRVTQISG